MKDGNPYIRKSRRDKLDPHIDNILKELDANKAPEEVSYVILKLLIKGIGVGVREGILVQGVMTETLANYQAFIFLPREKLILLQRWIDPDGSWS